MIRNGIDGSAVIAIALGLLLIASVGWPVSPDIVAAIGVGMVLLGCARALFPSRYGHGRCWKCTRYHRALHDLEPGSYPEPD